MEQTPALSPPWRQRYRVELWGGLLTGMLGAAAGFLFVHHVVRASASSTSAIGYLFSPFVMAIAAAPASIWGFCAAHLLAGKHRQRASVAFSLLFVLMAPLYPAHWYLQGVEREKAVATVLEAPNLQAVKEVLASRGGIEAADVFVVAAAAQHPAADEVLLVEIASSARLDFNDSLGSVFKVLGNNRKGHSVRHLVTQHPNATAPVLNVVADQGDDYLLAGVIRNKNCPPELLQAHLNSTDFGIQMALTANPHTPPDKLAELARSPNSNVRYWALHNPSTPLEELERASKEEDAEYIRNAADYLIKRRR